MARRLRTARQPSAETLERVLEHRDDLLRISADGAPGGAEPAWRNVWLPGLDAAALYSILRWKAPRRYLEIGSGVSTTFVRRAIRDGKLATRITSIDPSPRREIDALCDEVVRRPLEEVPLETFDSLEPGDVLFVDSSHHAFMNSDVTVVFLEVLPRLRPGLLVQIHDVFLPYDYPAAAWPTLRFYSEQYLLAAMLLANPEAVDIVLPCAFVSEDPELSRVLDPLWGALPPDGIHRTGGSFWFVTR
ncbi:MAG: class I SAM-dependent methyltransferase [Candidatus Binatia bacterium]